MLPGQVRKIVVSLHSDSAGSGQGVASDQTYNSGRRPKFQRLESGIGSMRELIRTNDAVLVSAVVALLESAGFRPLVLDQNMSVLEGSLGVLPRRVLVAEGHELRARQLLVDAGLGHELRPDGS
jgi:putative signal transducing protein